MPASPDVPETAAVRLTRTVRFCVGGGVSLPERPPRHNTFAAWPAARGLCAYYELDLTCAGVPDARTGYLLSISELDQAAREAALPMIEQTLLHRPGTDPTLLMPGLFRGISALLPIPLVQMRWRISPFHSLTLEAPVMDRVLLRQQFEFAAAHRLHRPDLSDEENRRVYGKCNNPSGHGHNYRLEVAVAIPVEAAALNLAEIEELVHDRVISIFDHTHLNVDVPDFREVVPSVEHIARASYHRLAEALRAAGGDLRAVTVWETEKTSCTYPADAAAAAPSP